MIETFSLQRSMIDKNVSLLLEQLYLFKGNYLIIADENWAQANWADIANRCQCSPPLRDGEFSLRFRVAANRVLPPLRDGLPERLAALLRWSAVLQAARRADDPARAVLVGREIHR